MSTLCDQAANCKNIELSTVVCSVRTVCPACCETIRDRLARNIILILIHWDKDKRILHATNCVRVSAFLDMTSIGIWSFIPTNKIRVPKLKCFLPTSRKAYILSQMAYSGAMMHDALSSNGYTYGSIRSHMLEAIFRKVLKSKLLPATFAGV